MAFKGIRTYTGDESSNILMGQTGFIVVPASKKLYLVDGIPYISNHDGGSAALASAFSGKVKLFPVVRCIDSGHMAARSIAGDHFSTTGAAPADGALNQVEISLADTIYGPFNEIWTHSSTAVIVYLG
tara:strand:- start:1465 stop:1848 length:384 start_codon:yes stop_codon:yes gene_type:complete